MDILLAQKKGKNQKGESGSLLYLLLMVHSHDDCFVCCDFFFSFLLLCSQTQTSSQLVWTRDVFSMPALRGTICP